MSAAIGRNLDELKPKQSSLDCWKK